ncbi:hypothetical protein BCR36DRAFT_321189 [Piromyces finnis]|uniref:Amino acid transporter transmembrane domain-containing protein n=1 Tax=Piromyces finnis TaxID=1754191 RepID=A0A1Y1VGJ8_9FUNG|nr:hypothetical protein BCR36DRAFT_321189 [Piromyces finnis]|eukprot:ORX55270.1 hypothetical protein BCR36DRAFT_321189 [Piromyces finnis]
MSSIKPSLTLPSTSMKSPSIDGEETPTINKSVSFIDISGRITNKYNDDINDDVEDAYESDDEGSATLIKRDTTLSSEGINFGRKSTNSSTSSKKGSFLHRKSTTSSNSSISFRIRNSFNIVNRNKTLKKLLDTKTVGFAGGVTLLINGILGPGLIPTPQIFSDAGFIIPTLTFIFFAVFSTICAQFIIEAMQSIPGNKHFQGTVEFSTLINFYFGKKMHVLGQIILYLALQSANISSIIYSAQTMDNFIINIFKKSCGIAVNNGSSSSMFNLYCVDKMAKENSPFGDQFMLVTLGYIATFIFIFPVGFMNLQDNINLQIISFLITMAIFAVWFILFYLNGFNLEYVPFLSSKCQEVVGVVMFNFAFVTTIPSWINIKKKEVSVQKSLWVSTITSVILYVFIGYSAAISFKNEGTLNILSQLSSLNSIGKVTTYIFSIAILMVSIPVFSIIVRNNLVQNKICGYKTATFFSHILPWICVLPFQTGTLINDVINWTSLFFVSAANFIIPIIIYLKCLKFKEELKENHYFNPRQRELLKTIHWQSKTIQGFIDSYPTIKESKLNKKQKEKIYEEEVINNTSCNPNNTDQNIEYKEKIYDNKYNTSSQSLNNYVNEPPNIYLYKPNNDQNSSSNDNSENNNSKSNNLLVPPPTNMLPPSTDITGLTHRPTVLGTLPIHPQFISNYYNGIPDWIPWSPKTFAKICLSIISFIVVCVIGLNIYQVSSTFSNNINNNKSIIGLNNDNKIYNEPNNSYMNNENNNEYDILEENKSSMDSKECDNPNGCYDNNNNNENDIAKDFDAGNYDQEDIDHDNPEDHENNDNLDEDPDKPDSWNDNDNIKIEIIDPENDHYNDNNNDDYNDNNDYD